VYPISKLAYFDFSHQTFPQFGLLSTCLLHWLYSLSRSCWDKAIHFILEAMVTAKRKGKNLWIFYQ